MKILYPTTVSEPLAPSAAHGATVVAYDPAIDVPAEHWDADVLVVWGNPPEQLADAAHHLRRLRWVQSVAAGPDAVLAAGFAPGVIVTSGRGLHDGPVVEHTLALTLAAVRRLDLFFASQARHDWNEELGGLQAPGEFPGLETLTGRRIVIWGFGSIGQALAPHLAAFGAQVTGVATTPGQRSGFRVITDADLPGELAGTDLLIGVLPATEATHHAIGADVFAALPQHAWVVNVGRGATLDEAALVAAITAGELGGAALDVTEQEPLPATSPLWDTPGVIITSHAAGGRPRGVAALVEKNIAALIAGEPLANLVRR